MYFLYTATTDTTDLYLPMTDEEFIELKTMIQECRKKQEGD
jgi:hypothetical protein